MGEPKTNENQGANVPSDGKPKSKRNFLYEAFIKSHNKYLSWVDSGSAEKEDIEKIKKKIEEKKKEAESYAKDNNINLEIIIKDECLDMSKMPVEYKLPYVSDEHNAALAGLIIYLVIVKFMKSIKKYLDYVKETGLVLEFNGQLNYIKKVPNGLGFKFAKASGMFYRFQNKIGYAIYERLYSWYSKKKSPLKTFEHEFGHYLDTIKTMRAKNSETLKEYKNLIDTVQDKQAKPIVKEIVNQLDFLVTSEEGKAKAGWFVATLDECIQNFSVRWAKSELSQVTMSQAALIKMYNWITEKVGVKPTQGASKYVETYAKNLSDPENLLTVSNFRWWEENFADARAKSKGPIFKKIKADLGNRLKSDDDWKALCELANSNKEEDTDKVNAAKGFVTKLTKGKLVWGLAYRVLGLDNVKLEDLLKEVSLSENTQKAYSLVLVKCLNGVLNRIKQLKDIDKIIDDDGEIADAALKESVDYISSVLKP